MRISTSMLFQQGLRQMQQQQAALLRTQAEVASGKRIMQAADDPAGAGRSLALEQGVAMSRQFDRNAGLAVERLRREENVLTGAGAVLQRVRELALQGNNATLTESDRRFIAVEVRQNLDELLALANATDGNGDYLFAGYSSRTRPFDRLPGGGFGYAGDQGARMVEVGPGREVAIGDPGSSVFQAIPNGNGTFTATAGAGNAGSGVVDPGSVIDPAAWDADTHRIGFASASGAGPVLTFGDGGAVDVLDYSLAIDGITVYSAASTGAPAASLAALAAAINDDEGTTGVRAFIDAGVLYLERTSPPAGPIVVTESMSGGSDGDTDTVVGYFGAALSGASASTISRSIDGVDRFLARNGSGVIVAGGDFRSAVSISFGGVSTSVTGSPAPGDEFTLSPSVQQDMFTTLDSLVSALASAVAGSTASTVRANAINRALSDIDQAMERLLEVRAGIGARLGVVELVQQTGEDNRLLLQTSLSELRDVDFAEAISRLASQQAALEAAQQSFVRLQSLSLFNFL